MDDLTADELEALYGMDELYRAAAEEESKSADKHNRILKKLKCTLKPKIWQAIEWDLKSHCCVALGIVSHSEVKGRKEKGSDYHCQSTAMRHVYVDVSSCSYSHSYGGNVYLRLSKNRYLMMFIHG